MAFPLHRSLSQQSGRSEHLRTPRCHGKEWRPLTRSNAISCYNSDLATKLRRRSASLYIGYVSRKRVGRLSTRSAVRIYVQKRTQCATSCCAQGVGKVLAQVFTRKSFSSPACFEEIWPFADRELTRRRPSLGL